MLDFASCATAQALGFRLVAMDMDSTLITIECIDEIAISMVSSLRSRDHGERMRGEIEYHESLRRRLALLEGLDETALERVYEEGCDCRPAPSACSGGCARSASRPCSSRAASLLHRTPENTPFARLHPVEHPRIQERQTHGKRSAASSTRKSRRETARTPRRAAAIARPIIAIGDGANDLAMMAEAALLSRITPSGGAGKATYCFDYVGLDGL